MARLEAENRPLQVKIVHWRGVEEHEHTKYMEPSDSCAQSASQVAQLSAQNERLHGERDSACVRQAKVDTAVERFWPIVNARTAGSSQSRSQSESPRKQNVITEQQGAPQVVCGLALNLLRHQFAAMSPLMLPTN